MSETVALEGVWVLGMDCWAGGSQGEHWVKEASPKAVCLLASLCLPTERPVVVALHPMMLQAACASLEVLNISGHIFFDALQIQREERVYNITSFCT